MEDFQELHKSITDQAMAIAKKANIVSLVVIDIKSNNFILFYFLFFQDKTDEEKEKEVVADQTKRVRIHSCTYMGGNMNDLKLCSLNEL